MVNFAEDRADHVARPRPFDETQDVPRHVIAPQGPQRGLFTPPSLSRVIEHYRASHNVAGQAESGHGTGRASGGGCRGGALEHDEAAN